MGDRVVCVCYQGIGHLGRGVDVVCVQWVHVIVMVVRLQLLKGSATAPLALSPSLAPAGCLAFPPLGHRWGIRQVWVLLK